MENITLKDQDIIILDKKDTEYNIEVLENSHIQILEYDINNSQVNLKVNNYASVKYDVLNILETNVLRTIDLYASSLVKMNTVSLKNVVDNTVVNLIDKYASFTLDNLLILINGKQTITTRTNHNSVSGKSYINNVGVAIKNADIFFDTTGFVAPQMEKNDCRQLSKGIIIGDNAHITERPILLIDNYNVNAYHGASIGKMSEEQLFYLMSRGIPKKDAFMLILEGLIAPFLENIKDENKRLEVSNTISSMLEEE